MSLSQETPAGLDASAPSSSRVPGFLGRVRGMLLAPKTEWLRVERENIRPTRLFAGYVMPLAGLSTLVALLRFSSSARAPLASAVSMAAITFAFEVLGVYTVALIINALASFFRAIRDRDQALKVVTYAFTPLWISSVFIPFPSLSLPGQFVAGLYHTYLLYLGLRVLMKSPRDRALGYATTVVLSSIILGIVFTVVSARLGETIHMSDFRAFG